MFRQHQDEDGNTISEYEMEGENIVGGPGADRWNAVVNDIVEKAERRNKAQISYINDGVNAFIAQSEAKIAEFAQQATAFEEDSHLNFPWGALIEGLEYGVSLVLALEGPAAWIYGQVKAASDRPPRRRDRATHQRRSGSRGEARATGSRHLADEVTAPQAGRHRRCAPGYPRRIHTAMLEYRGSGHVRGRWIEEMVTWFGFPEPDENTVTQVIASNLNQQFDVMLPGGAAGDAAVDRQLASQPVIIDRQWSGRSPSRRRLRSSSAWRRRRWLSPPTSPPMATGRPWVAAGSRTRQGPSPPFTDDYFAVYKPSAVRTLWVPLAVIAAWTAASAWVLGRPKRATVDTPSL